MTCSLCHKEIVLIPSASQRARKFGGRPVDYTRLFKVHPECALDKRKRDTVEFIRRLLEEL